MKYRVRYEIDIDAATPLEAAQLAYQCMSDPDSLAPVLEVNTSTAARTDLSWKGAETFDLSEIEK